MLYKELKAWQRKANRTGPQWYKNYCTQPFHLCKEKWISGRLETF